MHIDRLETRRLLSAATVTTLPNLNYPDVTATVGDTLYFTTVESTNNSTKFGFVWRSDGTAAGTSRIKDPQEPSVDLAYTGEMLLAPLAGRLMIYRTGGPFSDDGAPRLFSIDNATGVATLLKEFEPTTFGSSAQGVIANGVFYFTVRAAAESEHPVQQEEDELWRSDGTAAGTVLVKDIQPTVTSDDFFNSDITDVTTVGNRVFFSGSTQANGSELWVSDGTDAGTRMVTADGAVDGITVGANRAFFYNGFSNVPGTPGDAPPVLSVYDPNAGDIAGTVFDDFNADGARQNGEPPLRGYKVYIDRNGDGICNTKERFTRASSTGRFRFDGLPAGTYTIRVVGVEGRRASTPERYRVKVTPDGTTVRYFGRTEQALVAGIVYMDAYKNGTIDGAETGMPGWTVFIDRNHDGLLDAIDQQTVTDELGRFIFSNVDPGSHQVRVVPKPNYRLTAPGAGYRSVTLEAGAVYGKANFGEKRIVP